MIFQETELPGVFLLDLQPYEDARGFFARCWCQEELAAQGLDGRMAQCSLSYNRKRGTLRGMHYQAMPYPEVKVVRCLRGALYDVIVDLRPESPTYLRWISAELTGDNRRAIYVPAGCAHGFQTQEDETELLYQMSEFHRPDYYRGVRWNDPAFGIVWPIPDPIISDKDAAYPDYSVVTGGGA